MTQLVTWFRSFGSGETEAASVRQSLQRAGIEIDDDTSAPFGVLCIHEQSAELLSLLQTSAENSRSRIIAIIDDCARTVSSWTLLGAGASDVLYATPHVDVGTEIRARMGRWQAVEKLANEVAEVESLIGASPAWRALLRSAVEAAYYTRAPILITGESGTGKEMLAKLISIVTSRAWHEEFRNELVTVDCAALVPELSGSEFFGHERGAFTGAHSARDGAFALADKATLFLDEIGDVPLSTQAQLLRAIQEGSFKRVGGNSWQTVRFRLVCATNQRLEQLVQQGRFRLDLYHRVAGCVLYTPPLRNRREDVVPLALHFLKRILPSAAGFDDCVKHYLRERDYPGNIRELRQLVHRTALRHAGTGPISAGDVPEQDRPADCDFPRRWPDENFESGIARALDAGLTLKEIAQAASQVAVKIAVQSEKGNLQRAAQRLGITDRALQLRRANGHPGFR